MLLGGLDGGPLSVVAEPSLVEAIMPNVELHRYSRPARWRRMALAAWPHSADPQVYARLEVDMGGALAFAEEESERTGIRIAPLHLVTRAVALALKKYPDANALVRCGRVYARKRVHVFCQVAIPGRQADLSGAILRDVDGKGPAEIAREISDKARQIRRGVDPDYEAARRILDRSPTLVYRMILKTVEFLCYTLNLNVRLLGIPPDPFGGAMITSVGSLGMREAFAPLVPRTRVPLIVSVGKLEDRPAVRDGQLAIRPTCTLCATFDHRVMDGLLSAKLAKFVTAYLTDPGKYEREQSPG